MPDEPIRPSTAFLLMAQYNGRAVIPLEWLCRDYFTHLTPESFMARINRGEIALPLVRIAEGQKAAKGVHLNDLATYIDKQTEAARKECRQLNG